MRSKQSSIDKHYAYPFRTTPIRKISGSTASDSISFEEFHDFKIDLPPQSINISSSNQTPDLPQFIHKGSGDYSEHSSKLVNQNMFASPQIRGTAGPIKKRSDDFTLDGDSHQTPGEKEQSLRIRKLKNIVQEKQSKNYQINCNFSDQSTKRGSDRSEINSPPPSEYYKDQVSIRKPIYRVVSQSSDGKSIKQVIGYADSVVEYSSPYQFAKASNNNSEQTGRFFNQNTDSSIRSSSNSIQIRNQKRPSVRGRVLSVTTPSQSHQTQEKSSGAEIIIRQKSQSRHSTILSNINKKQIDNYQSKAYYNSKESKENEDNNVKLLSNIAHTKQHFILKQCLDQYDHSRLETLNKDEMLDSSYLEEFLSLNHSFVEQNTSLSLNSIERMYTNNCKATLECLMKCTIPQKSTSLLAPHTVKLSEKYNKMISQIPKTQRNKFVNSTFSSKQILPENYIRSPFDIVLIVDFNEQYQHSIIKTIRELILNQTSQRDRVALVFPSKQGKCVRTDLLLCTPTNQQLLINAFEQTVSDSSRCNEFHEISLKNAVWTIKERQNHNFQSALFWISQGQSPSMLELAQDMFLPSSVKSFCDTSSAASSRNSLDEQEKNIKKQKSHWKKMQVYTFQYGQRNTDLSLQKIAEIKKGKYYFITHIEDLQSKICEAVNELSANVGFEFSASVDLITHHKIKIKKQLETQSTLSSIPQMHAMESTIFQQKNSSFLGSFNHLKEPISAPTQSEINKLQQQNYKLLESEISKMYWGQKFWNQNDKTSISVSLPLIRHNSERKIGFQITIKPSHFLSKCDIAEFEIANAICMINTVPSHLRGVNNSDFTVKKFGSCVTELHFLMNRNSQQSLQDVKRQTFNDFSKTVSCDLSNLPKNRDHKNEVLESIYNQEMFYLFEDIYSNIKDDDDQLLKYAAQQLKNSVDKQLTYFKSGLTSYLDTCIENDIEEFQKFVNIFGFDERAKCYLGSIVSKYSNQL